MFVPIFLKDWMLVANKMECKGSEIGKARQPTVSDCAAACKGISSMFAYGTDDYGGDQRCFDDGCKCYCETAADRDGSCQQKNTNGYRLYKYIKIYNPGTLIEV